MKIFKNKFLLKLISTLCLFLVLFNFTGTNKVYAEDKEVWGGVLIKPITNLLTGLGDAIMDIMHSAIRDQETTLIKISGTGSVINVMKRIGQVVLIVAVAVGCLWAAWAMLGVVVAHVAIAVTTRIGISFIVGVAGGAAMFFWSNSTWFATDIYLPAYTISAEEIFANKINLFDVNFFNPHKYETVLSALDAGYDDAVQRRLENFLEENNIDWILHSTYDGYSDDAIYKMSTLTKLAKEMEKDDLPNVKIYSEKNVELDTSVPMTREEDEKFSEIIEERRNIMAKCEHLATDPNYTNMYIYVDNTIIVKFEAVKVSGSVWLDNEIRVYKADIDSSVIKVDIMEITKTYESTAKKLQGVVSTWYYILRNTALLVLMLVLIYTGIRIVIGSTAGEKAKYKERLMDWLVAVCLVMIMHYIMVFAITIVENITDFVYGVGDNYINGAYIPLSKTQKENLDVLDKNGVFAKFGGASEILVADTDAESGYALSWNTDLIGSFRIKAELENEGTAKWVGYSFCFIVLVLYLLIFSWTYIKRVVYMAFLTMIAPLVAMTYPIDKMTDGKAQAFNAWLKEYIFNLLIQPLHLLLYTILVTSAYELVSTNAIYALVALGFITPAEKLMRKFFGFEKAQTPGLLGGAAGAALTMAGLQKLGRFKGHGGHRDKESNQKDETKLNFVRKNNIDTTGAIAEGNEGRSFQASSESQNADESQQNYDINTQDGSGDIDGEQLTMAGLLYDQSSAEEEANISTVDTESDHESESEPEDEESSNDSAKSGKNKRSFWRAVGVGALGLGGKVLKGVHPLKLAGKIAAGATVGTAGMLAGVVSGDPNKVLQYTTAGAVAGSSFAGAVSNMKILDEKTKKNMEMAYYGDDYKKYLIEEQEKAFIKNKDNINYLRQTLGVSTSEAKEILQDTGKKCLENGITSMEDIATIHKLTDKKQKDPLTFEKAVAGRNYAKSRLPSKIKQMNQKQIKDYKARWADEFKEKGYANGDYLAEEAFNMAIKFSNTQRSLEELDS